VALDILKIKDQASKISSSSTKEAKQASFEAFEMILDQVTLSQLQKKESLSELKEIKKIITEGDKVNSLDQFTDNEIKNIEYLKAEISKANFENDISKFANTLNLYSRSAERLLKISNLLEIDESVLESEEANRKKIQEIIKKCRESAVKSYSEIIKTGENKINKIPNNQSGEDQIEDLKRILNTIGLLGVFKNSIQKKEAKLPREENVSLKKKKRIINRIINSITFAQLPTIMNSKVDSNGDLYKLYKTLAKENFAWSELALKKYVFADNLAAYNEFKVEADQEESPKEEHQLNYLAANRSWALSYIKGEKEGILTDKEESGYVTKLENSVLEKEKEIKNYYLAKDFNLGNFGGLQINPQIKLPLYKKVNIPISEEDRKKESSLRNIIGGAGLILGGLLARIDSAGNEQMARAARERNIAVFNGINSIIKGIVTVTGGKQAAREYEKGVEKTTSALGLNQLGIGGKPQGQVKEDMLVAPVDSPSYQGPGELLQTPGSIVSDMDTMSLAGPGKKKDKKKEKSKKIDPIVKSFKDFMDRNDAE
jgi:hypothetical protein